MAVARPRQGFVLIVTSIALTLLLALAGLGIDIGRMYVIRAELQSFTDAAALSAALELNGTDAGLARARTGAARWTTGPGAMRWNMGTESITNVTTSFAQGAGSPDGETPNDQSWRERPAEGAGYRFVRVVASEPAPVIFLRLFQPFGISSTAVAAASVAEKSDQAVRLIQ